eukprot:TRINITY_DN204_c0_g2_i1.p1 TRINITY_DN204_c0_g2~~TRINITY_DN204_c0_g2_i1.p1  ORF type:complete len:369 (+),score=206.53 TRINITY_DN204_c0_g2_i1:378-1484(+)
MATKPRVLVLGGCGFIGRNFVQYLAENNLCSKIRVADKVLPALASLSAEQRAIFDSELVEFKQANLSKAATVTRVFDETDGHFQFVFNLAGETKYSQAEAVYQENIIEVSLACAREAARLNVEKFIEVSTAQVFESGSRARREDSKTKPWTGIAKAKLLAEAELRKIPNLHLVIVRPATVYGPGDISGIMPRLIIAAVYKSLGEKMEFLWDKDLRINTVHVRDVCSALWHLTARGVNGAVYNLADQTETDQGSVNKLIEHIFGIRTSFLGNFQSKIATSVAIKTVAETANDKHLKPWSDLTKAANISSSPLTPYLDEELLYDNDLSVDGSFIVSSTGFNYQYPRMTEDLLRESITYWVRNGAFPANIL